jgi:hypothetical protein
LLSQALDAGFGGLRAVATFKVNRTDEFGLTVENTYDLLMGLGFRVSDPSPPA